MNGTKVELNNLKTKYLGRICEYYKEIDSTQLEIHRRVENNTIKTGTLLFADIQTNGKGTHGRKWYTDESNNIAFSFFAKLDEDINKFDGLTKKIAEICVQIFKEKYDLDLQIKEPNDIMYTNKKIGGILTETKLKKNIVSSIVVGIGINTNKTKFNEDIREIATSIKKEFDKNIVREDFIVEFCNRFEELLEETII